MNEPGLLEGTGMEALFQLLGKVIYDGGASSPRLRRRGHSEDLADLLKQGKTHLPGAT